MKKINQCLDEEYSSLKNIAKTMLGYPCNLDFSYSELYRFLEIPINNVGDPMGYSNYALNTLKFEKEVIAFIAKLYEQPRDHWGYVTNGGTEGNLCALHIARKIYPDAMVYYSRHSHYSIVKNIQITRSEALEIPVLPNGEMNYVDLEKALIANRTKPAIIIANIGTTMTGAIDDVRLIKESLKLAGIEQFYIHCDAALHGMMLPFTDSPKKFKLSDVHSLAISGHKFIGSPIPCGIFLTHQAIIDTQKSYVEYIDIHDCTITGSRNAFTPLALWYSINKQGISGLSQKVQHCLDLSADMVNFLQGFSIKAWSNPHSPIVIFPKPSLSVVKKWQLACYEGISHIVVMPHVNKELLKQFSMELAEDYIHHIQGDKARVINNDARAAA